MFFIFPSSFRRVTQELEDDLLPETSGPGTNRGMSSIYLECNTVGSFEAEDRSPQSPRRMGREEREEGRG